MNKKVMINDIVGGPGIIMYKNENTSNVYSNGEYIDVVSSTTNISLDTTIVNNAIDMQLQTPSSTANMHIKNLVREQVLELLKKNVQFEVVKWTDDKNNPAFTCMVCFDGNVVAEKDIIDGNV